MVKHVLLLLAVFAAAACSGPTDPGPAVKDHSDTTLFGLRVEGTTTRSNGAIVTVLSLQNNADSVVSFVAHKDCPIVVVAYVDPERVRKHWDSVETLPPCTSLAGVYAIPARGRLELTHRVSESVVASKTMRLYFTGSIGISPGSNFPTESHFPTVRTGSLWLE